MFHCSIANLSLFWRCIPLSYPMFSSPENLQRLASNQKISAGLSGEVMYSINASRSWTVGSPAQGKRGNTSPAGCYMGVLWARKWMETSWDNSLTSCEASRETKKSFRSIIWKYGINFCLEIRWCQTIRFWNSKKHVPWEWKIIYISRIKPRFFLGGFHLSSWGCMEQVH